MQFRLSLDGVELLFLLGVGGLEVPLHIWEVPLLIWWVEYKFKNKINISQSWS